MAVIDGNIRTALRVEVNLGDGTELSDGILDGSGENLPDGLFVLELDFCLRRMDVDIDIRRIHFEIYKIRYVRAHGNQSFISLLHRLVEVGVLHVASIDEEEFRNTLLACRLRFGGKAADATHCRLNVDW